MALRKIDNLEAIQFNNNQKKQFMFSSHLIYPSSSDKVCADGQMTTTPSTTSTSSSQIRTSSPISSPLFDANRKLELIVGIDSSIARPIPYQPRLARAVQSTQSLKQRMDMIEPASLGLMPKYPSMRELAYQKLREVNIKNITEDVEYQQNIPLDKVKSKGRLKIAVYANTPTHLTVHIIEGLVSTRPYKSHQNAHNPAYVRITQIPEDCERHFALKTRIIEPTDQKYNFNDKFSFEICQLNLSNRLVFALWTINASSQGK